MLIIKSRPKFPEFIFKKIFYIYYIPLSPVHETHHSLSLLHMNSEGFWFSKGNVFLHGNQFGNEEIFCDTDPNQEITF